MDGSLWHGRQEELRNFWPIFVTGWFKLAKMTSSHDAVRSLCIINSITNDWSPGALSIGHLSGTPDLCTTSNTPCRHYPEVPNMSLRWQTDHLKCIFHFLKKKSQVFLACFSMITNQDFYFVFFHIVFFISACQTEPTAEVSQEARDNKDGIKRKKRNDKLCVSE